jgi:hypothetical protein
LILLKRTICPICYSTKLDLLVDLGLQPTSLVELCDNAASSCRLPQHSIEMWICRNCTHVHNIHFEPSKLVYEGSGCRMYNNGTLWQEHVAEVYDMLPQNMDVIVEVGAGDCSFLARIDSEAKKVAIDPCDAVEAGREHDIHVIRDTFYPEKHLQLKSGPTLVVMRHLLEHLEDPRSMLQRVAARAKDRHALTWIYIEVPNCENALEHGRLEDWTYEHPHHFTVKSMETLLESCGISNYFVSRMYGDEVLSVMAMVSVNPFPHKPNEDDEKMKATITRFFNARRAIQEVSNRIYEKIHQVALWGGAGKSAMLINLLNLPHTTVVVDSHDAKWGLYVPGTSIKIRSPETLKQCPTPIVIATTAWRADDIRAEILERKILVSSLWKIEDGILVEVPLG